MNQTEFSYLKHTTTIVFTQFAICNYVIFITYRLITRNTRRRNLCPLVNEPVKFNEPFLTPVLSVISLVH